MGPISLVVLTAYHTVTLTPRNSTSCIYLRCLPTTICYFDCLYNSLSNLICDISYQSIQFTTTHCFTKLVENHTRATMISADMLLKPLPYYLIFHLMKTLFHLVSSRTKNPLEICSTVAFMVDLEGRRTKRNRIPTFVTTNFTGFLPHVHFTFQQERAPSVSHCTSSPRTTIYSVAPNLTNLHSL
jgi:hypothetical protein